jgi:hypothetical protein
VVLFELLDITPFFFVGSGFAETKSILKNSRLSKRIEFVNIFFILKVILVIIKLVYALLRK